MTKSARTRVTLPAELHPKESTQSLIGAYLDRLRDNGITQVAVADELQVNSNFISMLRTTQGVPMPLVLPLARAMNLSPMEAEQLLDARLMELHGQTGEICVEALSAWGKASFGPHGDEGRVISAWRDAISPAPDLLADLLADPSKLNRLSDFMRKLAQKELIAQQEDALAG